MKKWMFFLASILFMAQMAIAESTLDSPRTDFCTSYPEGTKKEPNLWKHCCIEHDLYFWAGGSKDDRNFSDLRLRECVNEAGSPVHARIIYLGVKLGSLSPIKFETKKWGNGWKKRSEYKKLSSSETQEVIELLEKDYAFLTSEIRQVVIQTLQLR